MTALITALFCVVTQRVVVTALLHVETSGSIKKRHSVLSFGFLGADMFSRNVCKKLPSLAT